MLLARAVLKKVFLHHSENKYNPYYWPWGSSVGIIPDNVNVTQNYEHNCEKTYILLVY